MGNNYELKELKIEQLYVNPNNARFINSDELQDEIAAIEQLAMMHQAHIVKLAQDIAINGLNPNELPIVIPGPDDDNRYLVMDGNRRVASIKLMTQYRDKLDNIGISSASKKAIRSMQCDIINIMCVIYDYDKEDQVNDLLEKLHTSRPGISQVKWDPQAQDRHQYKGGILSKRLAIIEMLRCSKHTTPEARGILYQGRWVSKLERFVRNDCLRFFGIGFDQNNNIILYLEEYEVIKGLCHLVVDLKNRKASEIAQTAEARQRYLQNFPLGKIPNSKKINKTIVIFNVKTKQFEILETVDAISDGKNDNTEKIKYGNQETSNEKENGDKQNVGENQEGEFKKNNDDNKVNKQFQKSVQSINGKQKKSSKDSNTMKTTMERTTLIPKDESIPIKNQRTRDLYEELKLINVNLYKNVVSIAFRSLVEFSINCFLEYKLIKWAYNEKISLFEKLEKVIRILESKYTKSELKQEIPAIYQSIDSYKERKIGLNSIPHLHIFIHSHNYHPTAGELKDLYNNYSPLLRLIWENINNG